MDNNFNNQPGGYRPYESSANTGYAPQFVDIFFVSPEERRLLKRQYSGTFIRAVIHGIGSFVLAQIFFITMTLGGYEFRYTEDGTAIVDWIYNIAGSLPSIIFCISIFLFDKGTGHIPAKEYFRTESINLKKVLAFFGMTMFAYGAAIFLQNILIGGMFAAGVSPIAEEYLTEEDLSPLYLAVSFVTTAILAPVAEELMFRGVILRRLSSVSQGFAIFASALIFGLMHGNFVQTILGFMLGIVFGYTAVKTGSLILPIAGHMFINTAAVSCSFAEYFMGEELSETYWMVLIIMFTVIGIITFIAMLASGSIRFPEFGEYHRKRTFPIVISCVSFWVMIVYYLIECISTCGPVTDKLME